MEWWESFFDDDYMAIWGHVNPPEQSEAEADVLVELLGLEPGDLVLDAPCGYGRISHALARRGMGVTGVDWSEALLARARETGDGPSFLHHDLRLPMELEGFDAAINLFSSIGYGSEEDDRRVLSNLHRYLRPGGKLFLDTMHRDAYLALRARGDQYGMRGPDGLTMKEKIEFDPIEGRIQSTWTWNSPTMSGSKSSSIRIYCPTELVALLRGAGFEPISFHRGIRHEPYDSEHFDSRLGILAIRPSSATA